MPISIQPASPARHASSGRRPCCSMWAVYAWYPTELPLQARNPLLTSDLLGAMIAATRAEGLNFMGRFDLSKGTELAYSAHPDWFCSNRRGRARRVQRHLCRLHQRRLVPTAVGRADRRDAGPLSHRCFVRDNVSATCGPTTATANAGMCRCGTASRASALSAAGWSCRPQQKCLDPVYRTYLQFQDAHRLRP